MLKGAVRIWLKMAFMAVLSDRTGTKKAKAVSVSVRARKGRQL